MRTYVPAAPLETTETNPGKAEIGRMGKQFTSVAPSVDMSTGPWVFLCDRCQRKQKLSHVPGLAEITTWISRQISKIK